MFLRYEHGASAVYRPSYVGRMRASVRAPSGHAVNETSSAGTPTPRMMITLCPKLAPDDARGLAGRRRPIALWRASPRAPVAGPAGILAVGRRRPEVGVRRRSSGRDPVAVVVRTSSTPQRSSIPVAPGRSPCRHSSRPPSTEPPEFGRHSAGRANHARASLARGAGRSAHHAMGARRLRAGGVESHERIFGMIEEQKIGGRDHVRRHTRSRWRPSSTTSRGTPTSPSSSPRTSRPAPASACAARSTCRVPSISAARRTSRRSWRSGPPGRKSWRTRWGGSRPSRHERSGIHVPFAPVLDVNNNPENPIINVRSFGEDPSSRSRRWGSRFIEGVQENGGIATGKHFPGHGDTNVDSHVGLPVIQHDRARMDSVELRPFQRAIDSGMGAIMTAHISVPGLAQRWRPRAVHALTLRADGTCCATRWASRASSSPTPWTCRRHRPPAHSGGGGGAGPGGRRGRHPHARRRP